MSEQKIVHEASVWNAGKNADYCATEESSERAVIFDQMSQNFIAYAHNLQVSADSNERWNKKFGELSTFFTALIEDMTEQGSDYLDDYNVKKIADILDVSLTEEVTYEVTIVATVTIEMPRGEDRDMSTYDFTTYGLEVSHDSLESNLTDYRMTSVEEV